MEDTLILLLQAINKKIKVNEEDLFKKYIFREKVSCTFIKPTKKKCNKKVFKDTFCKQHYIIDLMLKNEVHKNRDIFNFELEHYKDDYYKDVFNSVFEIKDGAGTFVGFIREGELILKIKLIN